MHYHADGHVLRARVADGVLTGELQCPGMDRCQASHDDHDRCDLVGWVTDVGLDEFAQWQEQPFFDVALPTEIEWASDWGDELWWRPAPVAANARLVV